MIIKSAEAYRGFDRGDDLRRAPAGGQTFVDEEKPPLRVMLPFVLVALAGVGTVLLPPYGTEHDHWVVALLCTAAVVGLYFALVRFPRVAGLVAAAPPLAFVIIAVARDASGGGNSGLAPLVMIPVLWTVLNGTTFELRVSAVMTALFFFVPLVLIGAPRYDPSDWRRGVLWFLVVALICPILQDAVHLLRASVVEQQRIAGQFSSVLRAATDHSIIATDLAGTITVFSEGSERMLGYTAEEIVGHSLQVLHAPHEMIQRAEELGIDPGFAVFIDDVPPDGTSSHLWTYRRRDASTLRVRLTISRLTERGQQTGWMGIARDVTAAEQAQHELETSEKRWRALLDYLPDTMVMVVGPALEYRVAMGTGIAREGWADLTGKTLFETSSAANIAQLEPMYRAALAGESSSVELISTASKAATEVFVGPLPMHGGDEEALVVARDVSQSRAREVALRVARDRFERLFDEAPNGTLLLDETGLVERVNPAFCAMVRRSEHDVVGQPVQALPGFADGPQPSRLGELLSGALDRVNLERTLHGGETEELTVAITAVALPGGAGAGRSLLVTLVDISEHRRSEERLSYLADHDPLTGLANRRKFDAALRAHLDHCSRYGATGAVLILDLDNFKQVNDTFGHGAGDALLVSVAGVLRGRMRSGDVVARIGGDEFAMVLPKADRLGAEIVARDVVQLISEQHGGEHGASPVTASVGVVTIGEANLSYEELMRTADQMMYRAKAAGGSQFMPQTPRLVRRLASGGSPNV